LYNLLGNEFLVIEYRVSLLILICKSLFFFIQGITSDPVGLLVVGHYCTYQGIGVVPKILSRTRKPYREESKGTNRPYGVGL
jgi:hypothetical protein